MGQCWHTGALVRGRGGLWGSGPGVWGDGAAALLSLARVCRVVGCMCTRGGDGTVGSAAGAVVF